MNLFVFYSVSIWLILINIVSFSLMIADKIKAKMQKWRIRESVLIGACFLGGGVGGILGMLIARHKIRKPKFILSVPLSVLMWFVILYFIGYFSEFTEVIFR